LEEYKISAPGKFQYSFVDPLSDKKIEEEAMMEGIAPLTISDRSAASSRVQKAYMGLVISYQDKKNVIPALSEVDNLEFTLTSMLAKLSFGQDKSIYIAQGKDIINTEKELAGFKDLLKKMYNVSTISVIKDDGTADNEAKLPDPPRRTDLLILIDSPHRYSTAFLNQVKEKIKQGQKVVFFNDPIYTNLPEQGYAGTATADNFSEILKDYGISRDKGLVLDMNGLVINVVQQYGAGKIYNTVVYPFFPIVENIAKEITALQSLQNIIYPFGAVLKSSPIEGITVQSLAKTSPDSFKFIDTTNIIPLQDWDKLIAASPEKGPFDVGYLVKSNTGSQVNFAVFGSVQMISNTIVNLSKNPDNLSLVLNTIDSLISDIDLSSIRSKGNVVTYLEKVSESTQQNIKIILSAIFPLMILILGGVKFYLRKRYTA
jgi:ABC-type uncharacterized transport system involved in gliding motility auxiliary subunit